MRKFIENTAKNEKGTFLFFLSSFIFKKFPHKNIQFHTIFLDHPNYYSPKEEQSRSISSIGTNESSITKRVTLKLTDNKEYDNDTHSYLTPITNPKFLLSTKQYDLPVCKKIEIVTIKNDKNHLKERDDSFKSNRIENETKEISEISLNVRNQIENEKREDKFKQIEVISDSNYTNKSINDKFVVNLYESRASKRWQTKKTIKENNNNNVNSSCEIKTKDAPQLIDFSFNLTPKSNQNTIDKSNLLQIVSTTGIYDMITDIANSINKDPENCNEESSNSEEGIDEVSH